MKVSIIIFEIAKYLSSTCAVQKAYMNSEAQAKLWFSYEEIMYLFFALAP